ARHFQQVLEGNPPDVTNRETISLWACNVHNIVNLRLEKPQFDCTKLDAKCGCADEPASGSTSGAL
ncbi:hypothetical protein BDK51DRAFT_19153, partial [Blyttiomyces helicus]